ncbi:hypothetical protein [Massilia sp. DWR3-1-1]|uniref:hypothetical protein n=1 Tax=Massilia sp. DWR3-1-1 TaxID=2804559 RepID=UPI003CE6786E
MKTTYTLHLSRLAGAALLLAASASAMAQSQEFRRGYDQGYRDGMAAAQGGGRDWRGGGHGGNDQGRSRIEIERADYGVREGFCDARPAVMQALARGGNFSITAGNQLCGDPAPRKRKRLTVTYRCGDGEVQRGQADEGDALTLNCR